MGLIYERGEARFDEDVWVAVVPAPGGEASEVVGTPPCISPQRFYNTCTVLNIQGRVKLTFTAAGG